MFEINLHEITINGISLPLWVFGLVAVIIFLSLALRLCVRLFIKPWAEEKFKTLEMVASMSPDIKKLVEGQPNVVRELREVKHELKDMNQVVQGFGTRLALIEEKHDVFEERTKERLTILETKMEMQK